MNSVFSISGPASALLLGLLATCARADNVTTAQCRARGKDARLRLYPTDSNATALDMIFCGLTEMKNDTYTGLPNLESIFLNENGIQNLKFAALDIPSLATLSIEDNWLRELPALTYPSLISLKLSKNLLTWITPRTFTACAKLRILALDNNHIDSIDLSVFSPLTELEMLYLNNNKIRFIPSQMFTTNGKLVLLTLNNNRITHLPTGFASSLKTAGVRLSTLTFHGNPWHCLFLLEALADVQRAGLTGYKRDSFNNTHYDGTRPECRHIIGMNLYRSLRLLPKYRENNI